MNRGSAWKKIRRKVVRAKPCPFCGRVPEFNIDCDRQHSKHGSWGHYAVRNGCCPATASGQTELFFTNNWKKPDYKLWWRMTCRLVDTWNKRV